MKRRGFIALLGATAMSPLAGRTQPKRMPVIGFLSVASPDAVAWIVAAFRQGLSETGYIEGQTVAIEYRWAEGRNERLPALAADLVARGVDVIATEGGPTSALAAKNATSTIPIVGNLGDPALVGIGSIARPGGNLTGFSSFLELHPKRLELLSELVPQARVIALLVNQSNPGTEHIIRAVQEAARAKGLLMPALEAGTEEEISDAFAALPNLHAGALVVGADPFFTNHRDQLVGLASHHAIPAIYHLREFVAATGLISYGVSLAAIYRQLGSYAGRILKGERPADLPVQQPTTFELVINLKTAGALGLSVPQSILARADEVIE